MPSSLACVIVRARSKFFGFHTGPDSNRYTKALKYAALNIMKQEVRVADLCITLSLGISVCKVRLPVTEPVRIIVCEASQCGLWSLIMPTAFIQACGPSYEAG